jgi:hypothetical protein
MRNQFRPIQSPRARSIITKVRGSRARCLPSTIRGLPYTTASADGWVLRQAKRDRTGRMRSPRRCQIAIDRAHRKALLVQRYVPT